MKFEESTNISAGNNIVASASEVQTKIDTTRLRNMTSKIDNVSTPVEIKNTQVDSGQLVEVDLSSFLNEFEEDKILSIKNRVYAKDIVGNQSVVLNSSRASFSGVIPQNKFPIVLESEATISTTFGTELFKATTTIDSFEELKQFNLKSSLYTQNTSEDIQKVIEHYDLVISNMLNKIAQLEKKVNEL